jgi:hypothetical protein
MYTSMRFTISHWCRLFRRYCSQLPFPRIIRRHFSPDGTAQGLWVERDIIWPMPANQFRVGPTQPIFIVERCSVLPGMICPSCALGVQSPSTLSGWDAFQTSCRRATWLTSHAAPRLTTASRRNSARSGRGSMHATISEDGREPPIKPSSRLVLGIRISGAWLCSIAPSSAPRHRCASDHALQIRG